MKVYVSSRFKNKELVKSFMLKLLTMRHRTMEPMEFVQTWQDEDASKGSQAIDDHLYAKQVAHRDLTELDRAEVVIILTEGCELVPGGMHFEAGYAYAQGKRIIVIGPRVHVFYHMGTIESYESIGQFLASNFESTL